jgi:ABC-2 type transport system ATP-binding protein
MTPAAPALELRGLTKSFGAKRAVDALNLTVPAGSMFGLVGPNGAGKTTTLSMATGLLRPDAGTAEVLGHDVWSDPAAAKALIGVLPDGLRLFDRLSGAELLRYVGLLRGCLRPTSPPGPTSCWRRWASPPTATPWSWSTPPA